MNELLAKIEANKPKHNNRLGKHQSAIRYAAKMALIEMMDEENRILHDDHPYFFKD